MQNKTNLLYLILIFSTCTSIAVDEMVVTLSTASVQKLQEVIAPSAANQSLKNAIQLYPIIQGIIFYWFPTQEQQARTQIARERLAFLKARENFSKCLFASKPESERTHLNCPIHCKELLNKFRELDNEKEAIKMIDNFDQIWK